MDKNEKIVMRKIHKALIDFPFSAAAFVTVKDFSEITLDDVLEEVIRLKAVIKNHVINCTEREKEYLQLSRDVDATRRLLSFNVEKAKAEKN